MSPQVTTSTTSLSAVSCLYEIPESPNDFIFPDLYDLRCSQARARSLASLSTFSPISLAAAFYLRQASSWRSSNAARADVVKSSTPTWYTSTRSHPFPSSHHPTQVSGARYVSSFPLLNTHNDSPYFSQPRGCNSLDGGAPFYDVYTCADGKWMSLGCLEPPFFSTFIDRFNAALQINGMKTEWTPTRAKQFTKDDWPKLRQYIADGFKVLPRDYWADVFHGAPISCWRSRPVSEAFP